MKTFGNAISILDQMFLDLGMNYFRADVEDNDYSGPTTAGDLNCLGTRLTFHLDQQPH